MGLDCYVRVKTGEKDGYIDLNSAELFHLKFGDPLVMKASNGKSI